MRSVKINESLWAYAEAGTSGVGLFDRSSSGSDWFDFPLFSWNGRTNMIYGLTLSPNEQWLACAGMSRDITVWDARDYSFVRSLSGHTHYIESVNFSPDGTRLLSASYDKTLKVWDVGSGACNKTLRGHSDFVVSGVFSPNGNKALSGSHDNTVKLWDIEEEHCEFTFEGHKNAVRDVQFSPDGRKALSGSDDSTVKLWDIERKVCEKTFEGHTGAIASVRFSLDGKTILSASGDRTIKLWSTESGYMKTLTGHSGVVMAAVFSPDESLVISCSQDKTVKVWNVQTGKSVRTFAGHERQVYRVCVSRDGNTIFSCSHDGTIKVWSTAKGTKVKTLPTTNCPVEIELSGEHLVAHAEDGTLTEWSISELVAALPYDVAFSAAMKRGSVKCRSIKVLFLGATEAGKTALVAALRGEELPDEEDRSIATRMHKLRMVYNAGAGVFETVPLDELRLASLLAGHEDDDEEEDVEGKDRMTTELLAVDEESNEDEGPAGLSVTPSLPVHTASDSAAAPRPPTSGTTTTTDPHHPPPPTTSPSAPSSAAMSTTMAFVRGLLANEIHEEHVDMDTFDFAGESMYDSLPALFMGSESVYVLVFDLSVMDFARKAQRQYEHLTKWAHIIAHQVPITDKSYFRVIIVGTHIDTFPRNTVPADLLLLVSREILRLVGPALGSHLMMPPDTPGLSFFQVGSRARLGLSAVSTAMHKAVRDRTLPLEMVAAQDLVGRWARLGNVQLMSSVDALDSLELNDTPHITLGGMMPTADAIRDGLVPYLESAADILVCRADATSQRVCDTDTIVFDVPRLIGALELLCSVVMAQWGRAKSKRALAMLREVEAAGNACDPASTSRLLAELTAAQCESECGFPAEVAEWLVWTAARSQSKTLFVTPSEAAPKSLSLLQKFSRMLRPRKPDLIPLLAGADVTDVPTFMRCLERLSLALRRGKQLVVPMLLPAHAPFLDAPVSHPAQVFLYQFIHAELLPVSLATFHLLMVALWRESLLNSPIRATQRCTNAMTMEGCIPLRLRLNANESFVRIELTDDSDAVRVQRTLERICVAVCNGTRSLRWGWRGTPVLVPAHPFKTNAPLFTPADVAQASEAHRRADVVGAELVAHAGKTRVCNERLEQWWVATQPQGHVALPPGYTHAAALVVGVSKYCSTNKKSLRDFGDLPGVANSVKLVSELWQQRKFSVRSVSDVDANDQWDAVTRMRIEKAALELSKEAGKHTGRSSLLIVHLIGHGVSDGRGGLVLSNAITTPSDEPSCFNLAILRGIFEGHVWWRGCNVLVICDFCNSGALVKNDIGADLAAPRPGYARQILTSSLDDANGYLTMDRSQTQLTELLVRALGPTHEGFAPGETVISVRDLRRRLQAMAPADMEQALLAGRIWSDWDDPPNEGDILLYREGNGVVGASTSAPTHTPTP